MPSKHLLFNPGVKSLEIEDLLLLSIRIRRNLFQAKRHHGEYSLWVVESRGRLASMGLGPEMLRLCETWAASGGC